MNLMPPLSRALQSVSVKLLAFFLLVGVACAAMALDSTHYYPLKTGYQWTYKNTSTGTTSTSTVGNLVTLPTGISAYAVSNIVPDPSVAGCSSPCPLTTYETSDQNGARHHQEVVTYAANDVQTVTFSPPEMWLPPNPAVGSTYTYSHTETDATNGIVSSDTFYLTQTIQIAGFETVSNFDGTQSWQALKVNYSSTCVPSNPSTSSCFPSPYTVWFVDGIGIVQYSIVSQTWKLTSTNVVPLASTNVVLFAVAVSATITATSATISTKITFDPPDVGKTGAVFVTARVPSGSLAPAQSVLSASVLSAVRPSSLASATSTATPLVLVQLTPSGWQQVVNGQLIPYASGVLGDQLAAQTILNNADATKLHGAQFCLGYGTSAAEMVAAGRMQTVATIPDPNATGPSTVSCIVKRAASDFDGDGMSDILWRNSNGQVAIWSMSGMAQSSSAVIATVGNEWKITASGDFDGDGKSDTLWRNSNGQVAIWLMNGMAQKSGGVIATVSTDWTVVGTGDFDGDGQSDILWRNNNGQVAIWLMNGMSQKSGEVIATVGTDWKVAATGDFDGDGKSDILWRNSNGQVAIWLMNGVAQKSSAIIAAVSADWTISATGDFNGDGKSDILWRNINGEAAIWLMNGMAQQSAGSLGVIPNDWKIAGLGDFDGDGNGDILWRNDSGQVAIWLINGVARKSSALLGLVSTDWKITGNAGN